MAKEKAIKKGETVVYLLAFGQAYRAEVKEVHKDQINADGGPTVDLEYEGTLVRHVSYNRAAQQPNSYCREDDPGWPTNIAKPDQAEVTAATVAERNVLRAEHDARSVLPEDSALRKAAKENAAALHAADLAPPAVMRTDVVEEDLDTDKDRDRRADAPAAADQTEATKRERVVNDTQDLVTKTATDLREEREGDAKRSQAEKDRERERRAEADRKANDKR